MSKRIKAVIMSHNCPENVDKLFSALSGVFDDVEVFDSGSAPEKIPRSMSRSFPNIYWTGLWEEVRKTCPDYDAVWVLGGDMELRSEPECYRKSIESSLPFGCWSPSFEGRAKPFMKTPYFRGTKRKVWNIEGMAIAVSGEMLRRMGEFPAGNPLGYGQDLWMCWKARWMDLRNYIDGGVSLFHPEGTGYSDEEAGKQMEATFSGLFGANWRSEAFHFSDFFDQNLKDEVYVPEKVNEFVVATVDNGWGLTDFARILGCVEGAKGLVVKKGVLSSGDLMLKGDKIPESVPYEGGMEKAMKTADVFLFAKVGDANRADYERVLKAGIPTVVHKSYDQGKIEHQVNGYVFYDDQWAIKWLSELRDEPEKRKAIALKWGQCGEAPVVTPVVAPVAAECEVSPGKEPKVSVITPTYKRDPKILFRCVSCMVLQTEQSWEQIVCSDGGSESEARRVVESFGDLRVRYSFITDKKDGDFGNTVRKTVLEKDVRGKYVMFLDDDNVVMPDYLEKMVAALEANPDADFALCRVMHFGPLNEAVLGKPPKVLTGEPVRLYHVDPLQVLVRREVMRKIGWDTEVGYLSDGVTLERLGNQHKHVVVDAVLGVHI